MNTAMLGLLAETPIHAGSGRGMGVVDLPVAREAATDYPVLVGSSLKGALKDKMEKAEVDVTNARFGVQDHAGDLLVSDARLLLLPVRSLNGSYRWVMCPHLVERYRRDLARAELQLRPESPNVERHHVLTTGTDKLFLEERQFTGSGAPPAEFRRRSSSIARDRSLPDRRSSTTTTRGRLASQYVSPFSTTTTSRGSHATVSPSRLATLWRTRRRRARASGTRRHCPRTRSCMRWWRAEAGNALDSLNALFPENDSYLQAGGNETVGQGWFAVTVRASCGSAPSSPVLVPGGRERLSHGRRTDLRPRGAPLPCCSARPRRATAASGRRDNSSGY